MKIKLVLKIFQICLIYVSFINTQFIPQNCFGNAFICTDSTHFLSCVDIGNGTTITVDNSTQACPPDLICDAKNPLQCQLQGTTKVIPKVTTVKPKVTTVKLKVTTVRPKITKPHSNGYGNHHGHVGGHGHGHTNKPKVTTKKVLPKTTPKKVQNHNPDSDSSSDEHRQHGNVHNRQKPKQNSIHKPIPPPLHSNR